MISKFKFFLRHFKIKEFSVFLLFAFSSPLPLTSPHLTILYRDEEFYAIKRLAFLNVVYSSSLVRSFDSKTKKWKSFSRFPPSITFPRHTHTYYFSRLCCGIIYCSKKKEILLTFLYIKFCLIFNTQQKRQQQQQQPV